MDSTPDQSREEAEDRTIDEALRILQARLAAGPVMADAQTVKNYLQLKAGGLKHEVFAMMYLDRLHRLIGYERIFRGTLTQTAVYPREIIKAALANNAAAVILHHNHPSGSSAPSCADTALTRELAAALNVVGIEVLDHVITSDAGAFSMVESRSFF